MAGKIIGSSFLLGHVLFLSNVPLITMFHCADIFVDQFVQMSGAKRQGQSKSFTYPIFDPGISNHLKKDQSQEMRETNQLHLSLLKAAASLNSAGIAKPKDGPVLMYLIIRSMYTLQFSGKQKSAYLHNNLAIWIPAINKIK